MIILNKQKRVWAEVNVNNLIHNYGLINGKVCCVVKANAYGHGATFLGKVFERLGAAYLAVSNIEEAIQLRKAGIYTPILVLGYTPIECAKDLANYNIEQTVFNMIYARKLNKQAEICNVCVKVHIKIDTGMGRIGFQYHDNINELTQALTSCKLGNLIPTGIFTHFAVSDEGINDYTKKQYDYFVKACNYLEKNGIHFSIKHCSNSAAIIDYPDYGLDMVRAGISLFGINPTKTSVDLKPVLSLWSVVSNVKRVNKGDSISYGRTFVAPSDMTIATVPIGYADGFWRSNQGHCVYINGEYCEIIGRVCMDQIMVKCKNVKIGDLVEVYGDHIPVEEVAEYNHTISYEILCAIGERVPRVYIEDDKIVDIIDKLI